MSVATAHRVLTSPALTADDRRVIEKLRHAHAEVLRQLRKKIVGQEKILEQLLICFFAGGHTLLVGVPGLAKTMMVRSLAEVLDLGFNRIQFTPDLMPSDVTGTEVIAIDSDSNERGFKFMGGPIINNMILADEINRTPPKTLASLLEAMEEGTVHVGGKCYELPNPFFVLATQNPIEQEGTYTLPAAALDRFMFNIEVDYPDEETERLIVELTTSRDEERLPVVLTQEEIRLVLGIVRRIPASNDVVKYATDLVRHTRAANTPMETVREYIAWGGSPRATQALILGAKARAILYGRDAPEPRDIRAIALPVLRHRLIANFHAESEGVRSDDVIRHIIQECPRPHGDVSPEEERRLNQLESPNRLMAMVWGPDNRKTRETMFLTRQVRAQDRLEMLARKSQRQRLSMSAWIAAISLIVLGLGMGATAIVAFLGGFAADFSTTAAVAEGASIRSLMMSVGVVSAVFMVGFFACGVGVLLRQWWGKLFALPLLALAILMSVLMFAFTEGRSWASLIIAVFGGLPFVLLILQSDDDY